MDFRAKKVKNTRILFPRDKMFYSTSQNERFVKYISATRKSCFDIFGYLETNIGNNLQYSERSYSFKNGGTLIWIMLFTSTKFALNKRTEDRKSVSIHRTSVFDKKSIVGKFSFGWKILRYSRNLDIYSFHHLPQKRSIIFDIFDE